MKNLRILAAAVAFVFAVGFVSADACDKTKTKASSCSHKTNTEKVSNEECGHTKEASQKAEAKTEEGKKEETTAKVENERK